MVTPRGRVPRFYHVVQTAHHSEDGNGWGVKASQDLEAFGRIVWSALREWFGDGIGAIMSYQDFGERGFAKRHPHMDLTMNGYAVRDGVVRTVNPPDLTGRGFDRWCETVMKYARTLDLTAYVNDVDFTGPVHGHRDYHGVLKYQMREMVDLRKLEYDRGSRTVWWWSYKDSTRTPLPADVFVERLDEYRQRLDLELHRHYGHLAKRKVRATANVVGGEPIPHGDHCPCSECGDWFRIDLTDEEISLNRGARIPFAG